MTIGYKNPPRRRTPEVQLQQKKAITVWLAEKYRHSLSWDAVGKEIGVSGPVVYRAVVKGQMPRNKAHRRALVENYDSWKARNMAKLLAIVAWAETPAEERQWPPV